MNWTTLKTVETTLGTCQYQELPSQAGVGIVARILIDGHEYCTGMLDSFTLHCWNSVIDSTKVDPTGRIAADDLDDLRLAGGIHCTQLPLPV
jgi:hypothetical protein